MKQRSLVWFGATHLRDGRHYLVLLVPAEVVPGGELLGPLYHKVDEVAAAAQAARDQEVGQHSEEPPQVDILVLLVLLLVHDGLLDSLEKSNGACQR